MFRSERMLRAHIVCKTSDVKQLTQTLYDLKSIHFKKLNVLNDFVQEDTEQLHKRLLSVRATINLLESFTHNKPVFTKIEDFTSLGETIGETFQQYREQEEQVNILEDELTRKRVQNALKLSQKDYDSKNLTIGFLAKNRKKSLSRLNNKKTYQLGDRVFFTTKQKVPFSFEQYFIPKKLLHKSTSSIQQTLKKEKKQLHKFQVKLQGMYRKYYQAFVHEERRLNKELNVIDAKRHFTKADKLSIISGFIPHKNKDLLEQALIEQLDTSYELVCEDVDDAPIKLEHKEPAHSFTTLLSMYTLPSYKEINPTILLALVFPIFFGFILGDVIYGIITLIFFTILKKKYEAIAGFCTMLQISSYTSIFFGMIYGEFAGFKLQGAFYGLFMRMERPEELLVVALIFGLLHLNVGLVLGLINNVKRGFIHTLYNSISWFILQLGVILITLSVLWSQQPLLGIGILSILIAAYLVYKGHGIPGVVEIPSFFTNILSYARLMAVGLSSVTIAVLITDYSVVLFQQGIIPFILGIIFFSIAHIFNIVLGTFEGFVHPLRLHYVEFFTKFYKGGGVAFKAFGEETTKKR